LSELRIFLIIDSRARQPKEEPPKNPWKEAFNWNVAATSFFLGDIFQGLVTAIQYMFQPKVTLNYPFEKGKMKKNSILYRTS
jgi:hypothetical protein